jgi:hypothetical protein
MAPMRTAATEQALIRKDLDSILNQIKEIKDDLKAQYTPKSDIGLLRQELATIKVDLSREHQENVSFKETVVTKDQIWLLKVIVYGAVATVLTAFMGAVVALVGLKGGL